MAEILGPLTVDQRRLVDVVWRAFLDTKQWPLFQYVEATLDRDGWDAVAVLASFPCLGSPVDRSGPRYSVVWYERSAVPRPDSDVRLTIAGLAYAHDRVYVELFFTVLRYLVNRRHDAAFSPTELTEVRVTRGEIIDDLKLDNG